MGKASAFARILLLMILLLSSKAALARIVRARDPRSGVLESSLIVIVHQRTADEYEVDEVFLGDKKPGDTLLLPGLKLFTAQEFREDIVERITANTRILLFLQPVPDAASHWQITDYGNCFFWVQEPGRVYELKNAAQQAVALRGSWENAASIPDPRKRVEALWPFLNIMTYGTSFFRHTKSLLQEMKPTAGDYFAEQFYQMPRVRRSLLYHEANLLGSEKLHQTLISHIKNQQQVFEQYLAATKLERRQALQHWNNIPEEMKDLYGEIYYGLDGVASFRDRSDLPLIRAVALWALENGVDQACEAALVAFHNMPDKGNLATIATLWKDFAPREQVDNPIIRLEVIRSLSSHLFPETVPLLAPFVRERDPGPGAEAREALTKIVGQDLGRDPQAWLEWYNTHKPRE